MQTACRQKPDTYPVRSAPRPTGGSGTRRAYTQVMDGTKMERGERGPVWSKSQRTILDNIQSEILRLGWAELAALIEVENFRTLAAELNNAESLR